MSDATALRIAIAGAGGRMGRELIAAVLADGGLRLAGAFDQPGSTTIDQDPAGFAGRTSELKVRPDPRAAMATSQLLIDFTRPDGTMAHLGVCRDLGVHAVIGTTGFSAGQKAEIAAHARHIGIVLAPNMSVGVVVTIALAEQAARLLGPDYDLEVVEVHHRHKVDAPSGTALALGEALARARGVELSSHGVFARHGHTGERAPGSIGFAALRGGDIVGDHTVLYAGTGERIEIKHVSTSRANYAAGALRAARFVAARGPGLYDMRDVLSLPASK